MLTASERKQLDRAYDQLLRIRTELHYQQKRAGDILTLRLQGQIADSFGYQHHTILRRIEAFMREYYHNAAMLFTHLYLEKLPWAPSCITLKPIAAVNPTSRTLSRIAQMAAGVKKTRWIYTKAKLTIRMTALIKRS